MRYILICGESFKDLDFHQREEARNKLINILEKKGIRFVEYVWIWDDTDRVQLLFYKCKQLKEARYWLSFLIKNGFNIRIVDRVV